MGQHSVAAETKENLFAPVSSSVTDGGVSGSGVRSAATREQAEQSRYGPFSHLGVSSHAGIGGVGVDVATPLSQRFNLRAGYDNLSFATSFTVQGIDVAANAQLRAGHAALDWFPFGGRFRVSPIVVFANNNQFKAAGLIPGGKQLAVNGQPFMSSSADPLHGNGSVTFRRVSPGLTAGFGNMIPRTGKHVTFPVEAGFYYVGQPRLNIVFTGSACDPKYYATYGSLACAPVSEVPEFQSDLQAFINHDNQQLKYASFFPVLSFGMGFSF
jgi:hypothetical protein